LSLPRAAEVSAMLAGRIRELARELLPGGKRDGAEWRCGSLAGDAGRSLAVHLAPPRAGVWADFATGQAGDALDLVAVARFAGDKRAALAWARGWLGIGDTSALPAPAVRHQAQQQRDQAAEHDQARMRKTALRLFLEAQPSIIGTPAAAYLAGRAIDLAELRRQPRALRFHPACWNREADAPLPAMLAAIVNLAGSHVATHRTWLAQLTGGQWTKARLRDPKMTLGRYAGGFIPLWRGTSGKPLREAPPGEAVALAEGIETALSVALACPELRVLAAVSLANMARVELPETLAEVILCADNDGDDNQEAAAALDRAAQRFLSQGRAVRIARSPVGKDFNDCLQAEQPNAAQAGA
jgi:hypothetical protein